MADRYLATRNRDIIFVFDLFRITHLHYKSSVVLERLNCKANNISLLHDFGGPACRLHRLHPVGIKTEHRGKRFASHTYPDPAEAAQALHLGGKSYVQRKILHSSDGRLSFGTLISFCNIRTLPFLLPVSVEITSALCTCNSSLAENSIYLQLLFALFCR